MLQLSFYKAGVALCVLALLSFSAGATSLRVSGAAYDLDGGSLLYSEQHYCSVDVLSCRVDYVTPEGELIARKQIDYSKNLQAPVLLVSDFRQDSEKRMDFSTVPDLVVDAGFDNFVRLQWERLVEGAPVTFPFMVPGREKPLSMRALVGDQTSCAAEQLCLRVELDSWFLRMAVPPILLTYDRESRRLLRFRGISNIRGEQGHTQKVDIQYRYVDASSDESQLSGS